MTTMDGPLASLAGLPQRALEGVTVIDLTHMLSGPYATMLMADLGARTIKVEPPGGGEVTRRLLKDTPDYARDGMGVGVLKRLEIDHDQLAAHNPRIITCAISGFGETGPARNRPAFDLVAQGMGGGMSLTGLADGDPLRAGIPIGDLAGGLFGVIGVLSALQARDRTGVGQHVDISMFDCQLSLLNYIATMYLMSGKLTERVGNGHFVHVPYNTFRTKTRHVIVAVITDNFWHELVDLLGDDELRREEFATQRGRLAAKAFIEERVQKAFEQQSCEHWLEQLALRRIPAAPVNDISHAFEDEQALARGMRVTVPLQNGDHVEQPGNPVKLSLTNGEIFTPPPRLGQHTARVLRDMVGLDPDRLRALAAQGVLEIADDEFDSGPS